jgi:hypothetical protein
MASLAQQAAEWLFLWPNRTLFTQEPVRGFTDARWLESIEEARAYIEYHNGKRNIYFQPSTDTREGIDVCEKMGYEEVKACHALFVDLDTYNTGVSIEAACRSLTDKIPVGIPGPCSAVNFSGGGLQGFWLLEEPFECNGDLDRAHMFKSRLLGTIEAFQGEADRAAQDPCRAMRLPFTLNIPNLNKLKKGRTVKLAEAWIWEPGRRYRLEDFPFVEASRPLSRACLDRNSQIALSMLENPATVDDLRTLPISNACRRKIENGAPLHNEDEWSIIMHMLLRGVPANVVLGVISDTRYAIGVYEHLKGEGNAKRQVVKAIVKLAAERSLDLDGLRNAEL